MHHPELDRTLIPKHFSIEIEEDVNKCEFLILYNEMSQHLEEWPDLVSFF